MRYEAVLISGLSADLSAEVVESIRELRSVGVHVGVVGSVDDATFEALAANGTGAILVWTDAQGAENPTFMSSHGRVGELLATGDEEDAHRAVLAVLWRRGI